MLKIARFCMCGLVILFFTVSTLMAYGYMAAGNPYQKKQQEYESLFREFNDVKSDSLHRMMGIEKFKLDLHQLLKQEGLLPEDEAEFVLKKGECTIDGKNLPKDLHKKIMQLCQESIGKNFTKDTKIVLQLNKQR